MEHIGAGRSLPRPRSSCLGIALGGLPSTLQTVPWPAAPDGQVTACFTSTSRVAFPFDCDPAHAILAAPTTAEFHGLVADGIYDGMP
jgi:hypothetical protein